MIPKVIHYFWFGKGEKDHVTKKCIDSWKKYCHDYKIIEWNEENYDITKNKYMYQAYQSKKWGFVSDFARLDVIYEYGGIYFDTDVEIIKNIDELLENKVFFGFEKSKEGQECYVNTGQGFGAEKKHPIIRKMLELYNDLLFINEDDTLNLCTCPFINTKALLSEGLKKEDRIQYLGDIKIYSSEYFCPFDWEEHYGDITSNTYSIHHYNASWLSDKEKKRRKFERKFDRIVHLPNRLAKRVLGENNYKKLKNKIKGI